MDARIGQLNGGRFYAYVNGYHQEPVIGSLDDVQTALRIPLEAINSDAPKDIKDQSNRHADFKVKMLFQYPAWDEINGITYRVSADSKRDAVDQVKRQAKNDGHAIGGRGRYWFKAKEIK